MSKAGARGPILLGGGGKPAQTESVDEYFCAMLEIPRVLYLPYARQPGEVGERMRELVDSFNRRRPVAIDVWDDPDRAPLPLLRYGALYLDGGNTFQLLATLRRHGIDSRLSAHHRAGGLLYGMSAGAIVLGADIGFAAYFDHDTVGLADLRGLDLLDGADVWPHYRLESREKVQAVADASRNPIIAIPEDGAALRLGPAWCAIGRPSTRFSPQAN